MKHELMAERKLKAGKNKSRIGCPNASHSMRCSIVSSVGAKVIEYLQTLIGVFPRFDQLSFSAELPEN
jgi:hypothetical protein